MYPYFISYNSVRQSVAPVVLGVPVVEIVNEAYILNIVMFFALFVCYVFLLSFFDKEIRL